MEVVADRRFGGSVRGDAAAELIKKEPNYKRKLWISLRSNTHLCSSAVCSLLLFSVNGWSYNLDKSHLWPLNLKFNVSGRLPFRR